MKCVFVPTDIQITRTRPTRAVKYVFAQKTDNNKD